MFLSPHCYMGIASMEILLRTRKLARDLYSICARFYGLNEYDIGNWRASRHRLGDKAYILSSKRSFPVSEPAEDWGARNLLYSLTFNTGDLINISGLAATRIMSQECLFGC